VSRDVAWCRSASHLAALIVAGRRRTSRSVCLRWLPDWLPGIYLSLLNVRTGENSIDSMVPYAHQPSSNAVLLAPLDIACRADGGSGCFGAGFGEGEPLVAEVGDDLQAAAEGFDVGG